tara:strand:- start:516 stop:815 length:300 start_codon:yes stop_codon:yes gene_type:complete
MENTQEDIIIEYINNVTKGIIQDLQPNNSYASWKNTPRGLNLIKSDKKNFYLGVNMWLNITLNQLIGFNENELLDILKKQCAWVNDLLEIKKITNYQEN